MIAASLAQPVTPVDLGVGALHLFGTPWRRIMLSERRDVWALVDVEDYDWLSENNWNISWGGRTVWQLYAKRNVGVDRATVRMHREIMARAEPRSDAFMAKHHVDHANGQTLDNRRINLGWATPRQNRLNQRPREAIPSLESIVLELLQAHAAGSAMQEMPF